MTQEEKQLIEKAYEWLMENAHKYYSTDILANDFKRAMGAEVQDTDRPKWNIGDTLACTINGTEFVFGKITHVGIDNPFVKEYLYRTNCGSQVSYWYESNLIEKNAYIKKTEE